jgi:glycine/D-amino acid oxidase-like deaminating enzyme
MSADVIVVGGGLEGTAAAWRLTQRGITGVEVLERHTVGSGGTGKSSGVVRCHYGVPSLAAMANKALDVFENATDLLGRDVGFHQAGYVVGVGEANVTAFRASLDDQRQVGVTAHEIGRDEVAALWPYAYLDDFAAFGYEPRGGYGDAYSLAQAFSAAARAAGARVRQHAEVAEITITPDRDRVTGVRLATGEAIATGTVVVAAGPWSVALLAPLGIDLPITVHREQIVLVNPGTDLGPVPVFSDLVSLQYVRPEPSGEILFGNSDLAELHPADPDDYPNRADSGFIELAAGKLAHRFPGLDEAGISTSYAGCYDVTPDWNPVISRTPVAGLIVAAGFSGHGFKIAPSVGELIADLVDSGASGDPNVPASDFRLSRFAEGDLLRTRHPYVGAGEMR